MVQRGIFKWAENKKSGSRIMIQKLLEIFSFIQERKANGRNKSLNDGKKIRKELSNGKSETIFGWKKKELNGNIGNVLNPESKEKIILSRNSSEHKHHQYY